MRHPSTARRDGDLSRLTSSSSSSSSTAPSSTDSRTDSSNGNCYDRLDAAAPAADGPTTDAAGGGAPLATVADVNGAPGGCWSDAVSADIFRSTYLPAVIDPSQWQATQSRKRKERQDSGSSSNDAGDDRDAGASMGQQQLHDRKLIRSNSVEYVAAGSADACDGCGNGNETAGGAPPAMLIRRVYSHEEFKRPLQVRSANARCGRAGCRQAVRTLCAAQLIAPVAADASAGDQAPFADKSGRMEVQDILKETGAEMAAHQQHQQQHRARSEISPARTRAFDFSHKIRVSPQRDARSHVSRPAGGGQHCDADADGEHERRRSSERFCRARAAPSSANRKQTAGKRPSRHVAARLRGGRDETATGYDVAAKGNGRRTAIDDRENSDPERPAFVHDLNDNDVPADGAAPVDEPPEASVAQPWQSHYQTEDQAPVVCPRYAHAQFAGGEALIDAAGQSRPSVDDDDDEESADEQQRRRRSAPGGEATEALGWKSLGHFMQTENLKTREMMLSLKSPLPGVGGATSPDERLRQINKRMTALKRRVTNFEEAFERQNGYRPSQADKQNDRCLKNAIAELHKLRREKQQLKADPMSALHQRTSGAALVAVSDAEAAVRLAQVRETIREIEERLSEKRTADQRPFALDVLSTDELMHEKLAVQKALVYFETTHGRPANRDERDAARPLYDRYRALKRLVNRNVSLQSVGLGLAGLSELPTIMEHEAMHFGGGDPTARTVGIAAVAAAAAAAAALPMTTAHATAPDSPLSELSTTESTDTTSSSVHENVHQMSLDELWQHLEAAREQKLDIRRTIKDFEEVFEQQNGRRMLKSDRGMIEQTYAVYKQKKARVRLLEALVKKHMAK